MSDMTNPIVTITMENGAVMTGELYPAKAPNTVANFISLANKGFYDGLVFHRVIPGFMILRQIRSLIHIAFHLVSIFCIFRTYSITLL